MRAPASADTGEVGQAVAAAASARIGWPATPTTAAQDLGTDLLIAARNRGFHGGEFVGAQVKSGASNLSETIHEQGEHVGWWVRVTRKHADYWLANALPHLLVLYDAGSDTCHWAHLSDRAVVRTDSAATIRVPRAQIVCADQLDDLLAVAAMARPELPLEGTAWTGAAPAAHADHLRFALIAPRLIAPHANSGLPPRTRPKPRR